MFARNRPEILRVKGRHRWSPEEKKKVEGKRKKLRMNRREDGNIYEKGNEKKRKDRKEAPKEKGDEGQTRPKRKR